MGSQRSCVCNSSGSKFVIDLTHVLTHTGIEDNGQGSAEWIYDLRVFPKSGHKRAKKHGIATYFAQIAAHNPEVVGSSPASETIKVPKTTRFSELFFVFGVE